MGWFLRGKGRAPALAGGAFALALWLGAGAAGQRPAGQRPTGGGLAQVFDGPRTPLELRRRLANLEASEIPALFRVAAQGSLGRPGDEALSEEERDLVRECLAARPRRELLPFLADLAGASLETPQRLEALRLLGAMGSGEHLKLLARLAVSLQERGALAPELRAAFATALSAILARDPAALGDVVLLFSESPPGLASSIVEALAQQRTPAATRILAGLLGRSPGLDPLLLSRLAERGPLCDSGGELVFESVRRYLRQRDPALVSAAAQTCGRLGDDGAVEALIGLIEHPDERVRASAFGALGDLSGLAFRDDAARWTSWYHAEMRWWDEEADSLLARVERGRGTEFVRAAREVLEHRLFRDRAAEAFALALRRENAAEVLQACRALEQLRSPVAVRALAECLEREEPVRAAAWRALRATTGVELPPESDSWAELAR